MRSRASIGAGRLCSQRGFSLFELVVVVLLIGVLMSFAMDRLMRMHLRTLYAHGCRNHFV